MYILAASMPAEIFLLRFSLWIDYNLHPHLVKIIHFVLIQNIETDFMIFEGIWHFEKEPLRVAIRVDIILQ